MKITLSIVLSIIMVVDFSGCTSKSQAIHISNSAYLYDANFSKPIEVTIDGKFNIKENSFIGSMMFKNEIKFENVLFSPGAGLVSYEGSKRTYWGQIFFDHEKLQYSMEITNPSIYELITNDKSKGDLKVIISSPATNLEQAIEINTILKTRKLPFED